MGSGRAAAPRLCRSRWQESVRLSRRRVEGRGWDRAGRGWMRQREEQAPGPGVGSDTRPRPSRARHRAWRPAAPLNTARPAADGPVGGPLRLSPAAVRRGLAGGPGPPA